MSDLSSICNVNKPNKSLNLSSLVINSCNIINSDNNNNINYVLPTTSITTPNDTLCFTSNMNAPFVLNWKSLNPFNSYLYAYTPIPIILTVGNDFYPILTAIENSNFVIDSFNGNINGISNKMYNLNINIIMTNNITVGLNYFAFGISIFNSNDTLDRNITSQICVLPATPDQITINASCTALFKLNNGQYFVPLISPTSTTNPFNIQCNFYLNITSCSI